MHWITWANWCWVVYGWNPHRHAWEGNAIIPVALGLGVLPIMGGLLSEDKKHIPVGARRSLTLFIGIGVAALWPVAVIGAIGLFGGPFLWVTVRDTVEWALIEPIQKWRDARDARRTKPEFPTAKVVDR